MSLKVVIPTPLRKHTGGLEVIEVDAGTVKEVIDRLESKFPGIRNSVCDDSGGLRRFINVYVDGEDVQVSAEPQHARKGRIRDRHRSGNLWERGKGVVVS